MRKYEVMLILPADADDATVKGAVDRINRVIGETGGEVTKTDQWGRRRLAYMIGKHSDGYYVVADMTADPTSMTELERVLHLADEVVRFKVTIKPPERVRKDAKSKRAADGAAAPAASEPDPGEPSESSASGEPDAAQEEAATEEVEVPAAEAS